MPITRITRLSDYRIFKDFRWPADLVDFKRYNLVYGWNGTGKSSLSHLLRNLEARQKCSEGTVAVSIDGNEYLGTDFDKCTLPIRVFNTGFVFDNVFTSSNQIAPIYVIGKENIAKQQQLDSLRGSLALQREQLEVNRTALRKADNDRDLYCIAQAKAIKDLLGERGNTYMSYNKALYRRKADQLIADNTAASVTLNAGQKDSLKTKIHSSPKPKLPLASHVIPDLDILASQVELLLGRTVVSSTISELKGNPAIASWVEQGLKLHEDSSINRCLFCDEVLKPERIAALEGHFSRAYAELMADIEAVMSDLVAFDGTAIALRLPATVALYDDLSSDYESARARVHVALETASSAIANLRALLDRKKSAPFDAIPFTFERPSLDAEVLPELNRVLTRHNSASDEFENRVASARAALESGLVAESLDQLCRFVQVENDAKQVVIAAEAAIKANENAIADLERDIVSHREPAEELNHDLRMYLGHDELSFEVHDTGYRVIRGGSVASALSEGEKTAIAVLYFLIAS